MFCFSWLAFSPNSKAEQFLVHLPFSKSVSLIVENNITPLTDVSLCLGSKLPICVLPYEEELNLRPSLNKVKYHVCELKLRPKLPEQWDPDNIVSMFVKYQGLGQETCKRSMNN